MKIKITFEELIKEYKKLGIEPEKRINKESFKLTDEMVEYIERSLELKLKRDAIGKFIVKKFNLNLKPITVIRKYYQYRKQRKN